ncbi:DNA-binding response regulator [Chryseobacterium lactis]|uniref:DNA-binding response regulator n=1 Tax=Chryseobacterium lactis TaxID=1241981 RepID=A0A3G6RKG5_CHRLC|nr:response regulator transcription factor [Chryseobacterium lactis]AZA84320.1 DNA-binding response regulator [Chryseobacterium lactis]AZB04708.1 DNA-binding response regulator [Chryseobacterium lactis]PNW14439.1 DNA-binding response regulator [Chryseobacterium lactis]
MKILVADDHPLTLNGTVSYLTNLGYNVVSACSNGTAALNYIQIYLPDVAVLDLNMPGLDGLEVAKKVMENKWRTKVIILTMHNEIGVLNKAKEFEVDGYILKEKAAPDLERCMKEIALGKKYYSGTLLQNYTIEHTDDLGKINLLTLSERKIIELIAGQKTSKQIAELLFLSEKTVEGHRTRIIEKLGILKEKNALLIWAIQNYKKPL